MADFVSGVKDADIANRRRQGLTLGEGKGTKETVLHEGVGSIVLAQDGLGPGLVKLNEEALSLCRPDDTIQPPFLLGLRGHIGALPLFGGVLKLPPVCAPESGGLRGPGCPAIGKAG